MCLDKYGWRLPRRRETSMTRIIEEASAGQFMTSGEIGEYLGINRMAVAMLWKNKGGKLEVFLLRRDRRKKLALRAQVEQYKKWLDMVEHIEVPEDYAVSSGV
jgi:hypothetical protein